MKTATLKSLNIKLPMTIMLDMDDRARLNPNWVGHFIKRNKHNKLEEKPIQELTYTYTFKIHPELHKELKLLSIEHNMPMNEYVGRLFDQYYL